MRLLPVRIVYSVIELSLILPAYNEARVIPTTIGDAVRYFESRRIRYEIIVAAMYPDGKLPRRPNVGDEP